MWIVSNDETVDSNAVQDLNDLNPQPLATQANKGEHLVSMMPAIKKPFDSMADDMVELSMEKESLKNKIGSYDEKWLGELKATLLKQFDDDKRANLILSRMEKQRKEQSIFNGIWKLWWIMEKWVL